MSIIKTSVKRPVGTIMFFIGVLLLGYISLSKLSINLLPNLSYPKLSILTEYPGSGPEEVEKFITTKLEPPLASIPGIKRIDSVSREGVSIVTLEFHWGTDMDFALLHAKEKTEEVRRALPDDCDSPVIMEWDPTSSPILIATIRNKGRNLKEIKETAEFIIKPRLEQLEGISRVEIRGGDEEEISVEIDPELVKNLGITLSEVARAIERNNIFMPGGTIKKNKFRYTLKIDGELNTPAEMEEVVVRQQQDRSILVKDIGKVFYKNKLKQGDIRFNSNSSIALLVYTEAGGNTVNATHKVEEAFNSMSDEFEGFDFFIISKEANLIISSINSLKSSLFLGAILAFFILLLFLQNYRDPLLVSTVIPISIISTFVLMFAFDVNINIMSLGGLVLGVGMFVDNSIIVLESIFRHRDNKQMIESVIEGAREVSGAISASTFTTISIFLPVIYLYGITGKLFRDQALTVSFSLVSSLVVALTLLPALSAFKTVFQTNFTESFPEAGKKRWFNFPLKGLNQILLFPLRIVGTIIYFIIAAIFLAFKYLFKGIGELFNFILKPTYKIFNKSYASFDEVYHNLLEKVLNKKVYAVALSGVVLCLLALTYLALDKELLPTPNSAKFEIKASTNPSYGFDDTNSIAAAIEKKLKALAGVEFVFTESGAVSQFTARSEDFSVNNIHFIVRCKNTRSRSRAMDKARGILEAEDLQNFSIFLEKNTLSQYLSMEGDNFQIKVFYEDLEAGKKAVTRVMNEVRGIEGLSDMKTSLSEGKPLMALQFKQDLLDQLNIQKSAVSNFIHQAVSGENAGTLKKIQQNFDIFVRIPSDGIIDLKKMLELPISINDNIYYLKDLVSVVERPSIKEIERESQERFFMVSARAKASRLEDIIALAEAKLENIQLSPNTRYSFSGEEEERKKAFDSLQEAIILAILLVYMIMAAKFENIIQPFIIMFTVPMGLVGAFLFLLISGNTLNIISGIGILVLIGIGVNDAIVKVEYSNQLRDEGKPVREAILTASRVRLRPILMTTFTTIFGLVPMAMLSSTGSELQRPLALVIIGGLLFTTFLTLVLIPVSYEFVENLKSKRKDRKKG